MSRTKIPVQISDSNGVPAANQAYTIERYADGSWVTATVYRDQDGPTTVPAPATTSNGSISGWVDRGTYRARPVDDLTLPSENFISLPGVDRTIPTYGNVSGDYDVWDGVHGSVELPSTDERHKILQVEQNGTTWRFNRTGTDQWQFAGGPPLEYIPSEDVVAGTARGIPMPLPITNCTYIFTLGIQYVYTLDAAGTWSAGYRIGIGSATEPTHWFPGPTGTSDSQYVILNYFTNRRYPKSLGATIVSRPSEGGNYLWTESMATAPGAFITPRVHITPLKAWE